MTSNRSILFQFFKYSVYLLLALNVYLFWREEAQAALVEFPSGVPLSQVIDAFATTIDTAAWLVLLLMFELETFVLDERHFTARTAIALHGIRVASYAFILYAFFGYGVNALDTHAVEYTNISDLCTVADGQHTFALDYDEYVAIDAGNCGSLSAERELFRFADINALVDAPRLGHIQWLAWADVINALVWILIVVILEVEVRMQEREQLTDRAVRTFTMIKVVLYSTLTLLAVYWGLDGDFVDFWDAFLWLVAFFFIEMNVLEWREEENAAANSSAASVRQVD